LTESVFKSSSAEVLDAWEANVQSWASYDAACKALADEFPNHRVLEAESSHTKFVLGLTGDETPGDLWRKENRAGVEFWTPLRRSKAGKALAERLGGIRFTRAKLPGMGQTIIVDGVMVTCGVSVHAGVVYAHWNRPADVVQGKGRVNRMMWDECLLSEFHLAREAAGLVPA